MPEWISVSWVITEVEDSSQLRRARRMLAATKPDPDGWNRIQVGRDGWLRTVVVGHADVDPTVATVCAKLPGTGANCHLPDKTGDDVSEG